MNFESFCAADTDSLDYLQKPFKVDGYAVACDGHRLICKPLDGDLPAPPSNLNKRVAELIAKCSQDGFVPLPEFTIPDPRECGICKGSGRAFVSQCPECDGEGEVDAETDYNTYYSLECKTCGGDGREIQAGGLEQCPECDGKGKKWDRSAHVNVLGTNINPRYLLAIADAPDLSIKPEDGVLLFRSGEFKGVIMAMHV